MRARQLELMLADRCGRTETDLDVRGRKLREAQYVPSGGRGPHAPQIDPRAAAAIVVAAFSADQAIDAVSGVEEFFPMQPANGSFRDCATFGDSMESVLANIGDGAKVKRVEFVRYFKGFVAAAIEWETSDGRSMRSVYLPADQAEGFKSGKIDPLTLGAASGGRSTFIGGGLLKDIGAALRAKPGDDFEWGA